MCVYARKLEMACDVDELAGNLIIVYYSKSRITYKKDECKTVFNVYILTYA